MNVGNRTTPLWWRVYRFVMRLRYGRQWPIDTRPLPPEALEYARQHCIRKGWMEE